MSNLQILPAPSHNKQGWPWTEETNTAIYDTSKIYPMVSIVMPTYNQGKYIEEAIRSLLLQNYPNLEFFVMDGGSTDETVEIIKKYQPWITYWESKKDGGQSNAINKGLAKCSGEWFNWLNSDDYFLPNALFNLTSAIIDANYKPTAVCGDILVVKENGVPFALKKTKKNLFYEDFIGTGYYQTAGLYDIDVVRMFNGLDENLHYTMDIKFTMQLNLVSETERVDNNIMVARTHSQNKGSAQAGKFYHDWIKAYAHLTSYIPIQYRNNELIAFIENITGVKFNKVATDFIPKRFSKYEYEYAQLYLGERIVNLMYDFKETGVKKMVSFYKKNHNKYYQSTNLNYISFKSNPLIQALIKIKHRLIK